MELKLKKMMLKKSDERLMKYLQAVKIATYEQIKRDIYPDYHLRSVCNRIYKLEDNKLVQGVCNRSIQNGERLISLTKKGFKYFVSNGGEERIELKSDAASHDLGLVNIRALFRGFQEIESYYTENEIQTWGRNGYGYSLSSLVKFNSDAVVLFQRKELSLLVPLEYEVTQKVASRTSEMVKRYYRDSNIILVFFLSHENSILNAVKKAEGEVLKRDKPKFFYSLLHKEIFCESLLLETVKGHKLRLHTKKGDDLITI